MQNIWVREPHMSSDIFSVNISTSNQHQFFSTWTLAFSCLFEWHSSHLSITHLTWGSTLLARNMVLSTQNWCTSWSFLYALFPWLHAAAIVFTGSSCILRHFCFNLVIMYVCSSMITQYWSSLQDRTLWLVSFASLYDTFWTSTHLHSFSLSSTP